MLLAFILIIYNCTIATTIYIAVYNYVLLLAYILAIYNYTFVLAEETTEYYQPEYMHHGESMYLNENIPDPIYLQDIIFSECSNILYVSWTHLLKGCPPKGPPKACISAKTNFAASYRHRDFLMCY